jgi:hypothetical protein
MFVWRKAKVFPQSALPIPLGLALLPLLLSSASFSLLA